MLAESLATHGFVVTAPTHTGNAAFTSGPYGSYDRPRDMQLVIDLMIERSASPGDPFFGSIDPEVVAIGGWSAGARASLQLLADLSTQQPGDDEAGGPRPGALMLIDGQSYGSVNRDQMASLELPTLSVSRSMFSTNLSDLPSASPLYGIEIANSHHWSFGTGGCQYLGKLVEAGAPQRAIDFVNSVDWLGCDPSLVPMDDVQAIEAEYAVAFFRQTLYGEDGYQTFLSPDSSDEGTVRLSVKDAVRTLEGFDLMLTDPLGRRLGVDPLTGEMINEVGEDARVLSPGRSYQRFLMPLAEFIPGEYVLTGFGGESVSGPTTFNLELTSTANHGVYNSRMYDILGSSTLEPGVAMQPLTFVLSYGEGAGTLTWDGLGNGRWGMASRWVGGAPDELPGDETDVVVKTDTVTVEAARSVRSLTIESGTLRLVPVGRVDVGETFTMQAASKYECQIGATGNGSIAVAGAANLGGTLDLSVLSSLQPGGQPWGNVTATILAAADVQGAFTVEPTPSDHLGHGVFYQGVTYEKDSVELNLFQSAAGDTDGNRQTNNADLQAILGAGSFGNGPGYDWTQGDFDGDSDVDNADLQLILATGHFGTGPYAASAASPIAVPEPNTVVMFLGAALALLLMRRRSRRLCCSISPSNARNA